MMLISYCGMVHLLDQPCRLRLEILLAFLDLPFEVLDHGIVGEETLLVAEADGCLVQGLVVQPAKASHLHHIAFGDDHRGLRSTHLEGPSGELLLEILLRLSTCLHHGSPPCNVLNTTRPPKRKVANSKR